MPQAALISMEMHQCLTRDSNSLHQRYRRNASVFNTRFYQFTSKIEVKCISIQHTILTVYIEDREEMHQYSTRDSKSLHQR